MCMEGRMCFKDTMDYRQGLPADIDRGRAWGVFVAAMLGAMVVSCSIYPHGVLYLAILERFSEGEAKTALISSICYGILCFGAPLGGMLINKTSCRFSIMLGSTLLSAGFFCSAFMPNVAGLIATLGVCAGFGLMFLNSGLVCVLGLYFKTYRNTVSACYFLLIGLGTIAVSPLCVYIVETYGLVMTFSILACIQAQSCIFGVVCKPSSVESKLKIDRNNIHKQGNTDKLLGNSGFDWTVLYRKSFLLFLVSVSCWDYQLDSLAVHLPNYVYTSGGSDTDISYTMMTFTAANVLGRVVGVILISRLYNKCLYAQALCMAVSGLLTAFFWSYSKVSGGIFIFAAQSGFGTGLPNAVLTALSLKFVGVSKMSEAHAMSYVACGIGMTSAPVITGYIYGETKSYETSFVLSGCVPLFGTICAVASMCLFKRETDNMDIELRV